MKIRRFVVTMFAVAFAIAPQLVETSTGAPGATPVQKPPAASPAPKPPAASPAPKPPAQKPPPASQSGG